MSKRKAMQEMNDSEYQARLARTDDFFKLHEKFISDLEKLKHKYREEFPNASVMDFVRDWNTLEKEYKRRANEILTRPIRSD
jgi:hypothetical protein